MDRTIKPWDQTPGAVAPSVMSIPDDTPNEVMNGAGENKLSISLKPFPPDIGQPQRPPWIIVVFR
ncbi:MAG: hypothetical protein AB3N21_16220 [Ruegeria sp.]|uniref:hypothetical protein n=1 Tax=Ruegeria sp. TaxID=1879320 RepID=UPI00349EDD52